MANVTMKYVIDLAAEQLIDAGHNEWTVQKLVGWGNMGSRQIVSFVPKANAVVGPFKLAAGARQVLDPSGIMVIGATRNLGTDGKTPGNVVNETTVALLSQFSPGWAQETAAATIKDFAPDPANQAMFWVSPPSDGTTFIELTRSEVPTPIVWDSGGAWETARAGVSNEYVNTLLDYILFRAFGKDTDLPGNTERSKSHLSNYLNALGITSAKKGGTS